ncbi:hypothetical protein BDZ91DRAFT_789996 [Kalaharituber pfeilii]|nr:hypothetical protein BDZ91DRAFT_789996 [Kalaharituber pfeilii]
MQIASALPFAPGAILLALVTLNIANPKRNKNPRPNGIGNATTGHDSASSRPMQTKGAELVPSLSAPRRTHSRSARSPGRSQSLNRNVYLPPSATPSISETMQFRHASSGYPSGARRGGPQTHSSHYRRVHRKPGLQAAQTFPDFSFPSSRRPANPKVKSTMPNTSISFLNHQDPNSDNRDLRLPAPFF